MLIPLFAVAAVAAMPGVREEMLMIPMRDGVRLSAHVFFPEGAGPWPAIVEQRDLPNAAPSAVRELRPLALHGFVAASVNFRGSQHSEGAWESYRPLGWGEHRDGYDLVEWFARQRWCTGKVGTIGGSQAGFAQNFLAPTRPPHLVCQYMTDTAVSLFHDTFRRGGATWPQLYRTTGRVAARDPADGAAYIAETFRHPVYDAWWRQVDCSAHFGEMDVPCFITGGWYDYLCRGSISSFEGRQYQGGEHSRGHAHLVLGPWLHGNRGMTRRIGELEYPPVSQFPYWESVCRWFDHYLRGINNGADREPAVRYYVMGALGETGAPGNVWRVADAWPVPAKETPYYFHAGGALDRSEPTERASTTRYRSDPAHPMALPYRMFPGARDARSFESQPDVRTFTTAPLAEPVEWTGLVRAELYVASTATDSDFIVRLSDVYPDGRSILIMDYLRRARFRDRWDEEVLMTPGRVYRIAFDVGWLSQIFNRGHRIRVTVASTGAPFYEPNPQRGEAALQTIFHESGSASRVVAPLRN